MNMGVLQMNEDRPVRNLGAQAVRRVADVHERRKTLFSAPDFEEPLQPIPEPSTGLLFGAGLIGIGLQRRRGRIGR